MHWRTRPNPRRDRNRARPPLHKKEIAHFALPVKNSPWAQSLSPHPWFFYRAAQILRRGNCDMARLGAFCFPGTGHINPMTALARALQRRGHEVVIYGIADCEARVRGANVEFYRVGETDYPPGTLRRLDERLG